MKTTLDIHIFASAFNLLLHAALIEEHLTYYLYEIRKGKFIPLFFSDNCGYYPLTLKQNLISGSFLNASGNVESEIILITVLH